MKKFNSNKELCSKTLNVGDEFMRERISYGYMSSNQYFICKIIEKKGAKITFTQTLYCPRFFDHGKVCANRTAKIMRGKLQFELPDNLGYEYSKICKVGEF